MDCPKCVGILQEVKIGGKEPLVVDRCPACGGIWFDKDGLTLAINKLIADTVEFDLELAKFPDDKLFEEANLDKMEIICPRCKGDKKMVKMPSKRDTKVMIDYCDKCEGVWLDAGEFKAVSKRSPFEMRLEALIDFFRLHFPRKFRQKNKE